jgi:phage shock protein E
MTALRAFAVLLLPLALVACSDSEDRTSADIVPTAEVSQALDDGARPIDVRTPEEHAAGHLPESVNIDVTAADFEQRIAELDPQASYVVYCRTGNRSASAVETMIDNGFDDVVNGGGYDDLVSAGLG